MEDTIQTIPVNTDTRYVFTSDEDGNVVKVELDANGNAQDVEEEVKVD